MKVSDETEKLVEKINDYSGKRIKNNFEVSLIIESALKSNKADVFNDIIFKAKYINGLKSVLSNRIVIGDDFMEKMFKEFNNNLQLFTSLLKDLISEEEDIIQKHFDQEYFELEQESIVNIMGLVEDLAVCKEFFNNNPEDLLNRKSGI